MKNLTVWLLFVGLFMLLFLVGRAARGAELPPQAPRPPQAPVAKADPFQPANAKHTCPCTGEENCTCGYVCRCAACGNAAKNTEPRAGAKRSCKDVLGYDDGKGDFTWGEVGGVMTWFRAVTTPPVQYAPAPRYYAPAVAIPSFGGSCSTCR